MGESFEVSRVIPASPEAIYKAWLSPAEHGQMTGSTATYNDAEDTFTAWDGYISGKTLEKEPYSRIVQTWRTTEFAESDPDSNLEVMLDPHDQGTLVTIRHEGLPSGQADSYQSGWEEHYFTPMVSHFSSARARLNEMGHAVSGVAEAATGAFETASEKVSEGAKEAVDAVSKTAKKASNAVKKLVDRAKKTLAARTKKARPAAKKAKSAAKKAVKKVKAKAAKAKPRPAAKKKAKASKKKRR